jgi:hypothetical protein
MPTRKRMKGSCSSRWGAKVLLSGLEKLESRSGWCGLLQAQTECSQGEILAFIRSRILPPRRTLNRVSSPWLLRQFILHHEHGHEHTGLAYLCIQCMAVAPRNCHLLCSKRHLHRATDSGPILPYLKQSRCANRSCQRAIPSFADGHLSCMLEEYLELTSVWIARKESKVNPIRSDLI